MYLALVQLNWSKKVHPHQFLYMHNVRFFLMGVFLLGRSICSKLYGRNDKQTSYLDSIIPLVSIKHFKTLVGVTSSESNLVGNLEDKF